MFEVVIIYYIQVEGKYSLLNKKYYKKLLTNLFNESVTSCHPSFLMHKYIPKKKPKGRTVIIGVGKGASEMAKHYEIAWEKKGYGALEGLVLTRYGHSSKCNNIKVIEASHPIPDKNGIFATKEIIKIIEKLTEEDLLIFLLSGGASSLLISPRKGLLLKDKQNITNQLLNSGASISEINAVRKHLSLVKGGQIIKYAYPAKVLTLAISDVPGDYFDVIGSGPTYPDETTRYDAINVLKKYNIKINDKISKVINNDNCETPNKNNKIFRKSEYILVARPQDALTAAAKVAKSSGFNTLILSDCIEGNADDVGIVHSSIVNQVLKFNQPNKKPLCILSGGETTVTVNNKNGRGGRNSQFLLSLAIHLKSASNVYAIACDTDGIDGSENNAGAVIFPDTIKRAYNLGLSPNKFLSENDTYSFFQKLDDLIISGPTNTNVNDFRAILIT